ncbi:MAG: deaminase, partial [bacterium]|nr:deaminase [bacterium]
HVVGTGYNGSVSGLETCDEVGHLLENNHCVRTLHGEVNAVLNAVREDLHGATAYIVGTPCVDCAKVLMQKGIARIVCAGTYANSKAREATVAMLDKKGVKLEEWPGGAEAVLKVLGRGIKRSRGAGGLFRDIPHDKFGEHLAGPTDLV